MLPLLSHPERPGCNGCALISIKTISLLCVSVPLWWMAMFHSCAAKHRAAKKREPFFICGLVLAVAQKCLRRRSFQKSLRYPLVMEMFHLLPHKQRNPGERGLRGSNHVCLMTICCTELPSAKSVAECFGMLV
ncbi:MAG: hypothetical protein H6Q96_109 [Nitrospirae bacterium]|nr:hypothetical protein [Nitrospirota bacterium]